MPQYKRRKLSLEEQDGKNVERNRATLSLSDGGEGKQPGSDAGSSKDCSGSQSLCEKRAQKNEIERKESAASLSSSSSSLAVTADAGTTVSTSPGDVSRVSSSGRVIKQTKKGRSFTAARNKAAQNRQSTLASSSGPSQPKPVTKASTPVRGKRARKRRSWDCWSKFESDAFFEGLLEHGKDFDAIHNLLVFRSKKRDINPTFIKTKEQVRYLYYRMWQKISKHINMGDNVKKETQEIYGLVNYYSIKKIFKRVDGRAFEHLNELIHTGVSKIMAPNVAGKKHRRKVRLIRTPVCNALKKLNNVCDAKEDFVTALPEQVTVELTPRSSAAWLKVHNLSQNPRVRFQVSVNRSLSALMEHLQKKWTGPDDRARRSLGDVATDREELVVWPHHSCSLEPVLLAPQRATSLNTITFSNYRTTVLDSPYGAGNKLSRKQAQEEPKAGENSSEVEALPNNSHRPVRSSVKTSLLPKLTESLVQCSKPPCEDENAMFPDSPLFHSPAKDCAAELYKSESTGSSAVVVDALCSNSDEVTLTMSNFEAELKESSPETSPQAREKQQRDEEREAEMRKLVDAATKGFTQESSQLVTLAELSLMMGKTAHIRLEYDWRPNWGAGGGGGGGGGVGARSAGIVGEVQRLTNMLRRLSNLANMEYREIMQRAKMTSGRISNTQCTLCGHSLDQSSRRRKTFADASTETEPLVTEAPGGVSMVHSAKLNSNGTLVGMASKTSFISSSTKDLMPDTDGVFRVPMPLPVPMPIRSGGPQRLSTQPTFNQLIRPPEPQPPKPNFMLPRKKKAPRRAAGGGQQRTLLPKPQQQASPLILVPHSLPSSLHQHQPLASPALQPLMPALQPASHHTTEVSVDTVLMSSSGAVSVSSSSSLSSSAVQEIDAGTDAVSTSSFLGDTSSDMFAGNLDMPLFVSATSSPEKLMPQQNQSQMFPVNLNMPVIVSATSSPEKLMPQQNQSPMFPVNLNMPVIVSASSSHENPTPQQLNQSQMFPANLDMPVIVSTSTLSPEKSAHPLSHGGMFSSNLGMQMVSASDTPPSVQKSSRSQQLILHSVSPPSLSSILDISLPAPTNQTPDAGDKFLDMVNGNTGFSDLLKSPVKREQPDMGGHASLNTPQHSFSTPPGSPRRSPLKAGAEAQWFNETPDLNFLVSPAKKTHPLLEGGGGDGGDLQGSELSLSRFLQSPVKKCGGGGGGGGVTVSTLTLPSATSSSSGAAPTAPFLPAPPSLFGESSQDSMAARLDVETALQSVMMESSIDYSSKFEKLAAHLADNTDA